MLKTSSQHMRRSCLVAVRLVGRVHLIVMQLAGWVGIIAMQSGVFGIGVHLVDRYAASFLSVGIVKRAC